MRALRVLPIAVALGAVPLTAAPQQQSAMTQVVDKIVAQEQVEVQSLRQYSPVVETYIQISRPCGACEGCGTRAADQWHSY
jgi:hypothetical protein